MNTEHERAEFEAWYVTQTTQDRDWWGWEEEHGQYGMKHSRLSWAAWRARAAVEAAEKAKAQRAANPTRRNAEQVVDTPHGVTFVTFEPVPCNHEFDQETEACTKCGMSIWSRAFRECP